MHSDLNVGWSHGIWGVHELDNGVEEELQENVGPGGDTELESEMGTIVGALEPIEENDAIEVLSALKQTGTAMAREKLNRVLKAPVFQHLTSTRSARNARTPDHTKLASRARVTTAKKLTLADTARRSVPKCLEVTPVCELSPVTWSGQQPLTEQKEADDETDAEALGVCHRPGCAVPDTGCAKTRSGRSAHPALTGSSGAGWDLGEETIRFVAHVVPENSGLLLSCSDLKALEARIDLGSHQLHLENPKATVKLSTTPAGHYEIDLVNRAVEVATVDSCAGISGKHVEALARGGESPQRFSGRAALRPASSCLRFCQAKGSTKDMDCRSRFVCLCLARVIPCGRRRSGLMATRGRMRPRGGNCCDSNEERETLRVYDADEQLSRPVHENHEVHSGFHTAIADGCTLEVQRS